MAWPVVTARFVDDRVIKDIKFLEKGSELTVSYHSRHGNSYKRNLKNNLTVKERNEKKGL